MMELSPGPAKKTGKPRTRSPGKTWGPRGIPGAADTAKMTPQEDKNIPKSGEFDGHTA